MKLLHKKKVGLELLKHWIKTDSYEPNVQKRIKHVHGKIFVDAGANTGIYSLMLHKNFKHVLAFEPLIEAYNKLVDNIFFFEADNIRARPYALSFHNGFEELTVYDYKGVPTDPVTSIQLGSKNHLKQYSISTKLVQTKTLASVLTVFPEVDLIKLDVEGNELKVFEGSKPIIENIRRWMVELHPCTRKGTIDFLVNNDYRIEHLDENHVYAYQEEYQ